MRGRRRDSVQDRGSGQCVFRGRTIFAGDSDATVSLSGVHSAQRLLLRGRCVVGRLCVVRAADGELSVSTGGRE